MEWYLQPGENLLLVAVDCRAANQAGAYPCRVVGSFSQAEKDVPDWANLPVVRETRPANGDARAVSRMLAEIGVPRNLLGYAYLRTGLTLLLEEPALGRTLTRSLYPRIAAAHQTTASSVERAVRHAIAQTFARDGDSSYRNALGRLASSVGDKPTNSEFFAQVAERLRMGA